ncbi:VOC family protein [Sinomonas atrocyanea]|jgi:catechol 2,3-dioxygenase-like lactoylglutathione lyase family enzyme|uniref:VOC family protein n=1 Tax=Sinomonas atrocyanea TaxID=37927 RepID=UPI0027843CE5|nr:VOC family protein [Sinomonas atrocyanea]MDQ0260921.1 catechol 2,3-dioxygenase-like lactoylglutathione lyase family enzyme [Sinomonas atrocyanea]MDR6622124.1 catechol 2,3-dioxygenase-like lactoylglutathione lyase family enzyme [Sinomonas atrocyanea]
MDWKIELAFIPVSDVDRSIDFYVNKVGFHLDYDQRVSEDLRFVQITPPGSACSIAFGEGLSEKPPGTAALQIVVADITAAHDELAARGVEVSDVQVLDWGHFVNFEDPDGNRWAIQYLPNRPNG